MDKLRERLIGSAVVAGVAGGIGAGAALGAKLVLERQAAVARGLIGKQVGEIAPDADKTYKKRYVGRVELLMLGDSIAAGLGAEKPGHTPGARLAKHVAKRAQVSVRLTTGAQVGSETSALREQLVSLRPAYRPDVAVIIVGGNDVTHRVPVADSVAQLEDAVHDLQSRGTEVVVGTCPDLGMLQPVPQPLRTLGSRASRGLAAAQRAAVLAMGARAVSLSEVVGPFFITNPDEMFSLDRFHPSSLGYKRTAKAILPSVLAALGVEEQVPFGHHVAATG